MTASSAHETDSHRLPVYNDRDNLAENENLTKIIQQRIKAETEEDCKKDQVNHVLRKLPNYEKRASGHDTAAVPDEVKNLMYQGWLQNKQIPHGDAARNVIRYVQERTNPRYTPTFKTAKSAIERWSQGRGLPATQQHDDGQGVRDPYAVGTRAGADTAPTVLYTRFRVNQGQQGSLPEVSESSYPDHDDHQAGPSNWAAPPPSHAYPTPGILYFDHNLRILQPHEINHLSYNAQGHLIDAEGYPVTTQEV
ncbi:hypothetical protein JCM8547_005895 [Rhodosporidiobolus lusitaniae]